VFVFLASNNTQPTGPYESNQANRANHVAYCCGTNTAQHRHERQLRRAWPISSPGEYQRQLGNPLARTTARPQSIAHRQKG
jgi:hypothetical protein